VIRRGRASEHEEVLVSTAAVVAISLLAMGLGVVFENQNIAFMVGLVFAIAASANFPVILLSIVWPDLTTRGSSKWIARRFAQFGGPRRSQSRSVDSDPQVWACTISLRQSGAGLRAARVRGGLGPCRCWIAAPPPL